MNDRLLLPEEVADRLRLSRTTVMRLLREGKLKGIKTGKLWRVREGDLEAFIRFRERVFDESVFSAEAQVPELYRRPVSREDKIADVGHLYKAHHDLSEGAPPRTEVLPTHRDASWLDAECDLPPYGWGPSGPPEVKRVRYVAGVGLVVEGGKAGGRR